MLTYQQIRWLLDGVREAHGIERRGRSHVTPALRKAIDEYEEELYALLLSFVAVESSWPRRDVEDFVARLWDDGDASLNVLMTLNGEGVGIWDGRWDEYFTEPEIERLTRELKRKLGRYADETGGGSVNEALMEAALEDVEDRFGDGDGGGNGGNGGNGGYPFALPAFGRGGPYDVNPFYRTLPNRGRRGRIVRTHEYLPGGYAEGMGDEDFDPEQLKMGIEVEMEHIDPSHPHAEEIAAEIARDHLREHPRYYDALVAAGL